MGRKLPRHLSRRRRLSQRKLLSRPKLQSQLKPQSRQNHPTLAQDLSLNQQLEHLSLSQQPRLLSLSQQQLLLNQQILELAARPGKDLHGGVKSVMNGAKKIAVRATM